MEYMVAIYNEDGSQLHYAAPFSTEVPIDFKPRPVVASGSGGGFVLAITGEQEVAIYNEDGSELYYIRLQR